MTGLGSRLGGLNARFGIPQYQTQVVLEDLTSGVQVLITPNPQVTQLTGSSYGWAKNLRAGEFLTETVQIMGDEIVIEGIPRPFGEGQGYTEAALKGSRYRLGAIWDGTRYTGGTAVTPVYLNGSGLTTWGVLVAPRRGK